MKYSIYLNQGNEYLGVNEKTITVNEVVETVSEIALAREINHENPLIPEQVAQIVLQNVCKAAANLMSMGYAIVLRNGNDAALRIYADIHVKGGNINLAKARQLMPDEVQTEADMFEHASDLVSRAGVTVRAKAECEQKFTELLLSVGESVNMKDIVERAKVVRTDGGGDTPTPSGSVAAPTISGTTPFETSTSVTMSGPTGAEIRYTTDGSTPTSSSSLYSSAITLSATTTVKAIAIKDGVSSEVTTQTFTKSGGGGDAD